MFCMTQIIFLRFTLYVWLWVTSESRCSSKEGNELALLEDALILEGFSHVDELHTASVTEQLLCTSDSIAVGNLHANYLWLLKPTVSLSDKET